MDLNLAGKAAVVAGASRGIGLAVVRALVAEGAQVTAGARHFGELPDGVRPVEVDLSTPEGPARLVEDAAAAYGWLDLLVNNVGAAHPRTGGFLSITDEDWIATLTLDLLATVRATRAALPHLLESRGTIGTVASVNAVLPDPLVMDYSAAKAAVSSFCKSLSKEVGPRAPEAVQKKAAGDSVTGRFTTPEEVAALVVMAASDRIGNVTGADIIIDGGLVGTL
jgi:NAD(P)-dependent dehydrogenase (short-subunit alcohol dehydrogenase family)